MPDTASMRIPKVGPLGRKGFVFFCFVLRARAEGPISSLDKLMAGVSPKLPWRTDF